MAHTNTICWWVGVLEQRTADECASGMFRKEINVVNDHVVKTTVQREILRDARRWITDDTPQMDSLHKVTLSKPIQCIVYTDQNGTPVLVQYDEILFPPPRHVETQRFGSAL